VVWDPAVPKDGKDLRGFDLKLSIFVTFGKNLCKLLH
jgi:hypothetical protein